MPTLTIQLPGLPPVEHILREEAITIGRMKGNSIALDDASVSLSHARITRLGNDYFLKDLNSTNGTMLNGQSINEARIRDGDRLKFGEVVALFRLEPMPAGTPAAAIAPEPAAQTVPALAPAPRDVPPSSTPKPASPAAASSSRPARKHLLLVLIPALGILCAAGVVGYVVWKMRSRPSTVAESAAPARRLAAVTPANPPSPAITSAVAPNPADTPSLTALLTTLKSADVSGRRQAAQAISAMETGATTAVPALRAALQDEDAEVRMWSALALVNNQIYDRATIPILVQVLNHESAPLRQVACISLALIPCEEADKPAVVAALKKIAASDASPDVRNDALTALQVIAPAAAR